MCSFFWRLKFLRKAFLIYIVLTSNILAAPDDYIYPFKEYSFSNYGTLGLIQNPNARFLDDLRILRKSTFVLLSVDYRQIPYNMTRYDDIKLRL